MNYREMLNKFRSDGSYEKILLARLERKEPRFVLITDEFDDSYCVPLEKEDEFWHWLGQQGKQPKLKDLPQYAKRVAGYFAIGTFTFTDPQVH